VDVAQFRQMFPEFGDTADYASATISLWLGVAEKLVNEDRWGNLWTTGLGFFTAHNVALQAANIRAAETGAVPGSTGGMIASKTVGSVSVGYDANATMELNAGHWNQTTYGRQYIHLARMIGAACVQL
jgi:hypothetical protein